MWATRSRIQDGKGPLCHFFDESVECFGLHEGISIAYAGALSRDRSGNLWFGGSGGFVRGKPGSFETFVPPPLKALEQLGGVGAFAEGPNGSMLIGMVQSGTDMGLQQFVAGHLSSFKGEGVDGASIQVNNMLTDRDGALWIGTVSQGLCVVRNGKSDYYRSSEGLSGNVINAIYEDRENSIWVVTSGGVDHFTTPKVVTFSSREGMSSDYAGSVLAASDDTVWVGNHDAVDTIRDGTVASIRQGQGLPGRRVTVLLEDHLGRIWVGADNTLSVREGGKFRTLSRSDGTPIGTLQSLIEDKDGDLWGIPAPNGAQLLHVHGTTVQEDTVGPVGSHISSIAAGRVGGISVGFRSGQTATYKDSHLSMTIPKANGSITQLHQVSDDRLLILSSGQLAGWQNGRPQRLEPQNGLPCDLSFTFLVDRQQALWLYSACGLVSIDARELQRWWADPEAKLKVSLFDSFDGVQAAQTSFTPRASEAPDGKLWFVNGTVTQVIDPMNLPRNLLAPPVHIENLIVDRTSYSPNQALHLPPLGRDLEIDYTALSLVAPQKVQFRYRLEGRDTDWQDPGARRQAFYTDLGPGRYRFHVMASNNDGVWNTSGASLEFEIEPALYQAWWVRTVALIAALAFIGWVIRRRMQVVAVNIQTRLVERQDERERIARELHDTLLQGILSASLQLEVAERQITEDAPAKPVVHRVSNLLRQLADESRHAVRGLRFRYSEEENLERALSQVLKDLSGSDARKSHVVVEGTPRSLQKIVRDEVYRIGAEALANALRHSHATTVEAVMEYARTHLRLVVRDNGKGIDPEVLKVGREGHFGLSGMRERAHKIGAELKIRTAAGAGTEIDLIVPSGAAFEQSDPRGLIHWIASLYSRVKRP